MNILYVRPGGAVMSGRLEDADRIKEDVADGRREPIMDTLAELEDQS